LALDQVLQHAGRAIGQDGGRIARLLQPAQHIGHFGKTGQLAVEAHQACADGWIGDAERLQREIEPVSSHLPKVGMQVLGGAQPSVGDLLLAPQLGDRGCLVAEHVVAARGGRGEVEQRTVGVEYAGAHGELVWHGRPP